MKLKKVISGKSLRDKMNEAISTLCDTVKTTLGPKGSNVIIDHSSFSPFITNDGVTIAENIESEDQVINTILELAKEASIKTNEKVGDGTTTTLVLLQSIYNNGVKLIDEGVNPIIIKRELDNALYKIIEEIKKYSRIPNEKELRNIARVSANDKEIGDNVSEVFLKIKNKEGIFVKEGNDEVTTTNYLNGYYLNTHLASPYFLKDLKELYYEKSYLLLIDNYLDNLEDIANLINKVIIQNKNIIIIAKDYSDTLVNEVVTLNIDNNINIVLLKNPEYGIRQISLLKDLALITNAQIIEKLDYIDGTRLGIIKNIKINNEETIIGFDKLDEIVNKINELESEKNNTENDINLDFINKRIAMLDSGMAEILVGDKTVTARREKKMRYDDALWAINSSIKGVLPGSGIILLKISDTLENDNYGDLILKNALKSPFEQIMYNAGLNSEQIFNYIKETGYNVVYNINSMAYENIQNTEIMDSTNVVINSLMSSVSIASMLLTTTSIVVNEYQNNLNKAGDYTEL